MVDENNTPRPIIKAASACVWRGDEVLLAQRGKAFGHDYWSLPGGKIEPGESAMEAAVRELLEETDVIASLVHHVGDFDLARNDADYVISCFTGHHVSGEAVAQSDAKAVAWVHYQHLGSYRLTLNNEEAISRAKHLLRR